MMKFTRKRQWIAVIVFILVVLVGLVVALVIRDNSTTTKPANLGSGLEYVGQQTVGGCFLWICESQPYTEYYFATDMRVEEMKVYFTKAIITGIEREIPPLVPDGEDRTVLIYDVPNQQDGFSIDYFDDTNYVSKLRRIDARGHSYIVRILDGSYKNAKSAL